MPDEPRPIEVSHRLSPTGLSVARVTSLPQADHKTESAKTAQSIEAGKRPGNGIATTRADLQTINRVIHPSWLALIEMCRELGYGEIERLSIQDGLPVMAETVKKKVKFTR